MYVYVRGSASGGSVFLFQASAGSCGVGASVHGLGPFVVSVHAPQHIAPSDVFIGTVQLTKQHPAASHLQPHPTSACAVHLHRSAFC